MYKMELRSKFNKLKELLISAGVYEDGMEVEEMRQMAQAMEMSVSSYNGVEYSNLERALLVNIKKQTYLREFTKRNLHRRAKLISK